MTVEWRLEMKLRKTILALTFLAVFAMFVNATYACCHCKPGLSPGYWKHNVRVYVEGIGSYSGDPKETATSMEDYEAEIALVHSGFTLEWANEKFQDNQYKSMWLTIANWFNRAAGRSPYSG